MDDNRPLTAENRAAIQEMLAVGASPQSQALRRYEITLAALEAERAQAAITQDGDRQRIVDLEVDLERERTKTLADHDHCKWRQEWKARYETALAQAAPVLAAAEAFADHWMDSQGDYWGELLDAVKTWRAAREG